MLVRSMSSHWWGKKEGREGCSWTIRCMHLLPKQAWCVVLWAVRPLSPSMIHEEEISWADLWPLGSYSKSAFGVIYDYLKSHGPALHRGPTLIGKGEPIHKLNSLIISVKVMLGHWAMTFNAWWLVHGRGMDLPLISRALFPGSGQVQWVSWLSQRY